MALSFVAQTQVLWIYVQDVHNGGTRTFTPRISTPTPASHMASQLFNPQDGWRGCVRARVVPVDTITNADVNGTMVIIAVVVVNFCLRIQVNFFTKSIDTGVVSTIAQLYSILLSTLFSIDRQQLSFFDANYALTITSSPFAMYLVFSSICDLFGFETGLFKRVETHRHIISFFGALLLPVWVGLRLTLSLSTTAFQESEICGVPNSKAVLLDFILLFLPLTGPFTGVWCILFGLIVVSLVAIFVGWFEVLVGLLTRQEGVSGPWKRLLEVWTPLFKDVWDTTSENHASVTLILAFALDLYWAIDLIAYARIVSGEEYVVSYGQLLALFAVLPPLLSTVRLIYGFLSTEPPSTIFLFFVLSVVLLSLLVAMWFLSAFLGISNLTTLYYDYVLGLWAGSFLGSKTACDPDLG